MSGTLYLAFPHQQTARHIAGADLGVCSMGAQCGRRRCHWTATTGWPHLGEGAGPARGIPDKQAKPVCAASTVASSHRCFHLRFPLAGFGLVAPCSCPPSLRRRRRCCAFLDTTNRPLMWKSRRCRYSLALTWEKGWSNTATGFNRAS